MTSETTGAGAELSPEERELRVMAIQQRFAEEYRAGHNPRLADYLRAYPEYAGSLVDFVARLLDEGETPEFESVPAPLSAGSRRALDAIFGPSGEQPPARLVAESRAGYTPNAPLRDDRALDQPGEQE